jgi:hypothetical protein
MTMLFGGKEGREGRVESLPAKKEDASTRSAKMTRYCKGLYKVSDDVMVEDFE